MKAIFIAKLYQVLCCPCCHKTGFITFHFGYFSEYCRVKDSQVKGLFSII